LLDKEHANFVLFYLRETIIVVHIAVVHAIEKHSCSCCCCCCCSDVLIRRLKAEVTLDVGLLTLRMRIMQSQQESEATVVTKGRRTTNNRQRQRTTDNGELTHQQKS